MAHRKKGKGKGKIDTPFASAIVKRGKKSRGRKRR
jgi:hypothetical protein